MRAARYPLAIVFAWLLIALPICAQICDLNCSFYGCALASTANASQKADELPACHKHKPHGQAPERKSSTNCAGHADVLALRSSITTSIGATPLVVSALIAAPLAPFHFSPERFVALRSRQPDRSPPARAVLRI